MHIAVLGGGVVGVTTAYELNRRGHRVTVIERHSEAGNETSKGNAAQRSYGVVYPWADPAMVVKAIPWLFAADGPLKMAMPPSMETLRFAISTLRYAWSPGLFGLNKRAMLRLGLHSQKRFRVLEEESTLNFDGDHKGLLHLASSQEAMDGYARTHELLQEMGIASRLLSLLETREAEPAIAGSGPLAGALSYPTDGTGDCHLFSRALADVCRQKGVTFLCDTEVMGLVSTDHEVTAVEMRVADGALESLPVDAVVVSMGCWSGQVVKSLGLNLPIYPVKGYCMTAPITEPDRAPRSTVMDDQYKVVCTRLGDRLRVSGFVELADFDRSIPRARLATLRKSVQSRFPGCADLDQADLWTGFRPMTPDGPAVLGRGSRKNLYLNTGHGTFGWTLSAGSADLIAQLIDGEEPSVCLDPFRPDRFQT